MHWFRYAGKYTLAGCISVQLFNYEPLTWDALEDGSETLPQSSALHLLPDHQIKWCYQLNQHLILNFLLCTHSKNNPNLYVVQDIVEVTLSCTSTTFMVGPQSWSNTTQTCKVNLIWRISYEEILVFVCFTKYYKRNLCSELCNIFCLLFLFASFNLILIILLNVLGRWQWNFTEWLDFSLSLQICVFSGPIWIFYPGEEYQNK